MHIHQEETEKHNDYRLEKVAFDDILPMWRDLLWNGRVDDIRPMSSMLYQGGYDMNIYERYSPTFYAIKYDDEIIACNSGHQTSDNSYRSRGLYVSPTHRQRGLAKRLLYATCDHARSLLCSYVWTVPRKNSLNAYTGVGFKQTSDWFDVGMEFGPNCYCKIVL